MFRFFIKLLRLLGLWPKEKDEALANQCIAEFDSVFASLSGRYITYKERQKIKATLSIPYKQAKSIHLPKRHDTYTKLKQIISQHDRLDKIIEEHNEAYIKNELRRCDSLLSDIDGKSLDAQVVLRANDDAAKAAVSAIETLTLNDMFIVSKCLIDADDEGDVTVGNGTRNTGLTIAVSEAKGEKCPRCWAHTEEADPETGLCPRCAKVVAELT